MCVGASEQKKTSTFLVYIEKRKSNTKQHVSYMIANVRCMLHGRLYSLSLSLCRVHQK